MSTEPRMFGRASARALRALREGLERAFGLSGYPQTGWKPRDCPPFAISWDDAELARRPDAHACTIFQGTSIKLCLRSDEEPGDITRSVVHELQHIRDWHLHDVLPLEQLERRAEVAASLFGPSAAVRSRLDRLG